MGQPFPRVHLCGVYGHLPVIETAALLTTEVTGLFVPHHLPGYLRVSHMAEFQGGERKYTSLLRARLRTRSSFLPSWIDQSKL